MQYLHLSILCEILQKHNEEKKKYILWYCFLYELNH